MGTLRNVVGRIEGREEHDRWVVIGNHRDAWLYGAVDPSSGTAALLEVARAMGEALKRGHRPRRTIVFANWDGEEELLGGSTSWVKDHREELLRKGVAYVNVDHAASGPEFRPGSTPALAGFLEDVSRAIPDPGGGSLYEAWARLAPDGVPVVEEIVGATDYTAFQEHLGMSCIDMSFVGPYGVYHSMYDNFFWLSRLGDPGFRYNTTLARLWGVLTWRLANLELLPMRYSDYAGKMAGYFAEIEKKAQPHRLLRLDAGRAAAGRWEEAAFSFERRRDAWRVNGEPLSAERAREVNGLLMAAERALTEPEGLKGRPFFKHLIYAPQPTYREEIFPRIFEAIERGEWGEIPRYEQQLADAFDRAAELLRRAAALLP
jgi:N-acetylated-alpha-linked acidic dipeptidase